MSEPKTVTPTNPATGEELPSFTLLTSDEVDAAIARSVEAFAALKSTTFAERAGWMNRAAEILKSREDELVKLMATEMGKPVTAGHSEVEKCAWVCRYYADNAESFLADETIETDSDQDSFIAYCPIGPVLAVMPWNFPLWQVFRFAAPALMAGNTGLLKHASNVQGCARAIHEIFDEAGFPASAFQNLAIDHDGAEQVISDARVRAVTLTGSTAAGRKIAETAGRNLKKTVLELGGSDPYVVLADADPALAAKTCAQSRLINSGQSCIAAKRFIVVESVRDEFLETLVAEFRDQVLGDPQDEKTTIGPMARTDLRDELADQVQRSLDAGATCLIGGHIPDEGELAKGAYYEPTILNEVVPGMPAFDEELFGPVAAVVAAKDEEEALELANRSSFGLGGAVFTRDKERGERLARERIDCGGVAVNQFVASDPRLPFGGVKDSGYGRELSVFGIREFVNIKTITSAKQTTVS